MSNKIDHNLQVLIDKLSCPLCKKFLSSSYDRNYNFACSYFRSHYMIQAININFNQLNHNVINKEKVSFFSKGIQFDIYQDNSQPIATIHTTKPNEDFTKVVKKVFTTEKFDFQKLDFDHLIKKTWLIVTFQ